MTRLYKNIKKYREKLGYTQQQLAFLTGYTDRTSIAKIEAGKIDLPLSKIDLFARALKTDPSALLGWNTELLVGAPIEKFSVSQRIPLLGDIACGEPIYADENFSSYIEFSSMIQADFCLRCKGDSMTGARIFDGDLVFIHSQPEVKDGEIAAVIIGDEATLKRVYYDKKNETLQLVAENSKYPPLIYSGNTLEQIRILGKAVAFQSEIR